MIFRYVNAGFFCRLVALSFAATGFGLMCGCGSSNEEAGYQKRGPIKIKNTYQGPGPIDVVCTTGMVADLVRNVGGEHVKVTQLMESDIDPHLYKASPGDMTKLSDADLIFYNGLHLEGKMTDVFDNLSKRKPVFAVAEYFEPNELLQDEAEAVDPHVWFDVSMWNRARGVVQEVLVRFDPDRADDYRKNGEIFKEKLDALHEFAKDQIASIPKKQRVMITAHDAFQYFGRAYDIQVMGIQGISTVSEASSYDVTKLVNFIVKNKIKAVFVESTVSRENIDSLIEGCRARDHEVVIGGELYSDAMGKAGAPEGTYEGMVRHNVETLVKALK